MLQLKNNFEVCACFKGLINMFYTFGKCLFGVVLYEVPYEEKSKDAYQSKCHFLQSVKDAKVVIPVLNHTRG